MVLCYAQASRAFDPVAVGSYLPKFDMDSIFTFSENKVQINPQTGTGITELAAGGTYVVSYRVTGGSTAAVPPIAINFTTQLDLNGAAVPGSRASQDIFNSGIPVVPVSASVAGYAIVRVPVGPPENYHLRIQNISAAVGGGVAADTFSDFTMTILRIR